MWHGERSPSPFKRLDILAGQRLGRLDRSSRALPSSEAACAPGNSREARDKEQLCRDRWRSRECELLGGEAAGEALSVEFSRTIVSSGLQN